MRGKEIWIPRPDLCTIPPPMQFSLAAIQGLVLIGIAAGLGRPGWRRPVALGLGVVGLACLATAILAGSDERTLDVSHRFSAYVGLTVQQKVFPIETARAPGWLWALVAAAFVLGWAAWLARRAPGRPDAGTVFGGALALAWTGAAGQLALEKAAAPAVLLVPFDLALERVLFPATFLAALLLARPGRKILHLVFYLALFLAVTRLPLAVFGTLATRAAWGTHLDVHGTTYFVPPGGGTTVGGIEPESGSPEQLFWLVWAPHLIVYPFFYMTSAGGFAFLRLMWARQREVDGQAG
jgi:hypothetical protein